MLPVIPAREILEGELQKHIPIHVVWEITLACDLKCLHCGSRAGKRRKNELSTTECLDVIDRLSKLGTREVSLIGGEFYLRKDWPILVKAIKSHGMYCAIQTSARSLTNNHIEIAAAAGLNGIGVSIDGLAELHDRLRGKKGTFKKALNALVLAKEAGIVTSVNTQIGPATLADLPDLAKVLIDTGVTHWQLQLTVPMGNAADNSWLVLQPFHLLKVMPLLADLYRYCLSKGLLIIMGNNIGYFGPYERLWRGLGDERIHWEGCYAGSAVLSIEADGTVKGCPSLSTASYAGGNIRDLPLEVIWRSSSGIKKTRQRATTELWGYCKTCYYSSVCMGGCTWMSHSLLGKPGNNPYCHYRAIQLEKMGLRESVVKIEEAANCSFSIGKFKIIVEKLSSNEVARNINESSQIVWPPLSKAISGQPSARLEICYECGEYVYLGEAICPHCGVNIQASKKERDIIISAQNELIERAGELLKNAARSKQS